VHVHKGMTLSQLVPIYLSYREEVAGKRGGTLKNDAASLKILMSVVGDIQPRNITTRHEDRVIRVLAEGKAVATFNCRLAGLKAFIRWCHREKLIPREHVPLDVSPRKNVRPERNRVPVERFGELLDAAAHPRDRILIACGLYLFLRASEIRVVKLHDVDLEAGEVHVYLKKTDDYDVMPISAELDQELRRWLAYYENEQGRLDPDWYLVPAKNSLALRPNEEGVLRPDVSSARLKPKEHMSTHMENPVKRALRGIGFDTKQEGLHTLRRSGARAYFDSLVDAGYDGALKRVSAMLHHASVTMTERYLGIREDRHSRNVAIRGRVMFPAAAVRTSAVSALREAG
jgi:integrase